MLAAFAAAAAATSQAHDVWGTGVNTTGWAVFAVTDFAIGGLTKAPDAQVEVIVEPKLSSGRPEVSHRSKVLYGTTSGVFDLHIYLPGDSSAVTVNLYDYCSWQEPGELIFTSRYELADCPAEQSATQGCALAWQEPVELPPLLAAKQFRPWHPWAASPGEVSARLLGYYATGAEMVSRVRVASRRGVGVQFEDVSRDPARFALGRIQNDAIETQLFFAEAGSVFPEALHGLWWMDQRGVSLKDGPYPSDPDYTQVCLGAAEENLISFGEASWDNETRCASGVRQYSGGPLSGHWTWFDESGNGESKPWSSGADWMLKYEFCFSSDDFDQIDVRTKIANDALGEITLPTFATMVRTSWGWDRVTTIPDAPAKLTEFLKTASIDSGLADWVQAKFGPGYGDFAASGFACHYPVRQVVDGTGKRTDAYSEYLAHVNMQTECEEASFECPRNRGRGTQLVGRLALPR